MNTTASPLSIKSDYVYQFDLEADSAPAKVVRMAGRNVRVLDLGAGPGSISAVLKNVSGCIVHAAEFEDDSLAKLQGKVDKAVRCDLNSADWEKQFLSEKYDVIILADVLEHLYDPLKTLRQAVKLMGPETQLIVSIPHVHHMALNAKYFTNDFSYLPYGLLDQTHIRFFGIKNIDALIKDAGLQIDEVDFVLRLPEETEFVNDWKKVPVYVKFALRNNPAGFVYQVVVKLSLPSASSLTVESELKNKANIILFSKRIPSTTLVKYCKRALRKLLPASLKRKLHFWNNNKGTLPQEVI